MRKEGKEERKKLCNCYTFVNNDGFSFIVSP